jgi:hypothetical protein
LFLDGADVEGGESGWMALEAGKRKKSSSCDALGDAIIAMPDKCYTGEKLS